MRARLCEPVKGLVGENNANLLGSMFVTKIYLAAMSRSTLVLKLAKPKFHLYVDEFVFHNKSFADILSEARKYKLSPISLTNMLTNG